MKKGNSIIIILVIIVLGLGIYLYGTSNKHMEIQVDNNVSINDIEFDQYEKLNDYIYMKENNYTKLIFELKGTYSFTIGIGKSDLKINYDNSDTEQNDQEPHYHFVRVVKGSLNKLYFNDNLIYNK